MIRVRTISLDRIDVAQLDRQEIDRLVEACKPRFLKWTDWILDGDAVTYGGGGGGLHSPSGCRWLVPYTGHNVPG